jgi:hypothetical protein
VSTKIPKGITEEHLQEYKYVKTVKYSIIRNPKMLDPFTVSPNTILF